MKHIERQHVKPVALSGIFGRAFTLIEVLVVVILLGVLAAIVLPKFSNASATARASMLADDLRVIRTQIMVFKAQHCGVAPGYPNCSTASEPTETDFVAQMTMASDVAGSTSQTASAVYCYGPYLRSMPPNPVNGKSTVTVIADSGSFPVSADDSHGWIYQPATCLFRADSTGSDDVARTYFDY